MPHPGSADYEAARDLGRRLAEAGFAVQTGGYAGIMEAVSRGANEAGGHVVGVTCATFEAANSAAPNAWVKEVVQQPNLPSRVLYLVTACDGAIVMPGGVGTLSELALAWSLVQVREVPPKPIVLVGGLWQRTRLRRPGLHLPAARRAAHPGPHTGRGGERAGRTSYGRTAFIVKT
jgi:uncharacterized protein (TIGR00730 family)